ncbi:potassium channel subfamily K member 6-like [Carcharodon carcharias]|uniref:potassium channel subfamily K member 6-like n=1 Tax=Carcharodon carcharias TaxID=13397 RepID=UPI001B7E2C4A|nr:potassium channel subfamily K member 6-like [Carcharodon carcharias]
MARCGQPWLLPPLLALFYLCYLLLGAAIVSLIEQPHERRLREEMRLLKSRLLNSSSCLAESDLERFLERALAADRYGASALNNTSHTTNWDFASAFFFTSTLITTVGYGHTTPVSDGGKAFSIFFAILGVPLTMLVLTVIVQRLMVLVTYQPIRLCQERLGYTKQQVTRLHFLILLLLILVCFFLIPSAIFSAIERSWTFLDAFYFCFISLTTIGLGDYVPGEQSNQLLRPLYKLSVSFYLLCGLAVMLLLIQVFHKAAGIHGLAQIFDLPPAEGNERDEEMVLHPVGPRQSNGLKADHQLRSQPEPPSYKSILPSITR